METNKTNNKALSQLAIVSIATFLTLIIIDLVHEFLPKNIIDSDSYHLSTVGVIIMLIFLGSTFLYTLILAKINPALQEYFLALITGLLIFSTEFSYKIFQNVFINGYSWNLDYYALVMVPLIIGILGFRFSNIIISKKRKKSIRIPVLILIAIWFSIGFLAKSKLG